MHGQSCQFFTKKQQTPFMDLEVCLRAKLDSLYIREWLPCTVLTSKGSIRGFHYCIQKVSEALT